jgi:hypothetical protein
MYWALDSKRSLLFWVIAWVAHAWPRILNCSGAHKPFLSLALKVSRTDTGSLLLHPEVPVSSPTGTCWAHGRAEIGSWLGPKLEGIHFRKAELRVCFQSLASEYFSFQM